MQKISIWWSETVKECFSRICVLKIHVRILRLLPIKHTFISTLHCLSKVVGFDPDRFGYWLLSSEKYSVIPDTSRNDRLSANSYRIPRTLSEGRCLDGLEEFRTGDWIKTIESSEIFFCHLGSYCEWVCWTSKSFWADKSLFWKVCLIESVLNREWTLRAYTATSETR